MKKQNVNNKLAFGKATVTELNDNALNKINGGSSHSCGPETYSSKACVVIATITKQQNIQ